MEPQGKKQRFSKLSVKLSEKILLEIEIPKADVETTNSQLHDLPRGKIERKLLKKHKISANILILNLRILF